MGFGEVQILRAQALRSQEPWIPGPSLLSSSTVLISIALQEFGLLNIISVRDQHFGRPRQVNHLRSAVQDQPGQHGKTPSLLKIQKYEPGVITKETHLHSVRNLTDLSQTVEQKEEYGWILNHSS
ncbi:hypothetical protein AAY473_023507 [Plecturocebus cupreus]